MSSNQLGSRRTAAKVAFDGTALPLDTGITLCIGAADRDSARFADPDRLDVGRAPNRHLAFALGAHQCAGMALARLEGRVAVGRFLARFPNYAPDGPSVRGGRALPRLRRPSCAPSLNRRHPGTPAMLHQPTGRALLGAAALASTAPRPAHAQDGPVRIGVLTDETGPCADSGPGSVLPRRWRRRILAARWGRPIAVLRADTQNKPDVAGSIARQWYDTSGVDLVTDLPVMPVAAAVQPVAREKNRFHHHRRGGDGVHQPQLRARQRALGGRDTHALAAGRAAEVVRAGRKAWFFSRSISPWASPWSATLRR